MYILTGMPEVLVKVMVVLLIRKKHESFDNHSVLHLNQPAGMHVGVTQAHVLLISCWLPTIPQERNK